MSRQSFFCLQCRFCCVNLLADEVSGYPVGKQEPWATPLSAIICLLQKELETSRAAVVWEALAWL